MDNLGESQNQLNSHLGSRVSNGRNYGVGNKIVDKTELSAEGSIAGQVNSLSPRLTPNEASQDPELAARAIAYLGPYLFWAVVGTLSVGFVWLS